MDFPTVCIHCPSPVRGALFLELVILALVPALGTFLLARENVPLRIFGGGLLVISACLYLLGSMGLLRDGLVWSPGDSRPSLVLEGAMLITWYLVTAILVWGAWRTKRPRGAAA